MSRPESTDGHHTLHCGDKLPPDKHDAFLASRHYAALPGLPISRAAARRRRAMTARAFYRRHWPCQGP